MRLIVDGSGWGNWYGAFVQQFMAAGIRVVNVHDDEVYLADAVEEDTILSVHYAHSADRLLNLPRVNGAKVGAFVHTLASFPFTAGYRVRDRHTEKQYLDRYDHLFVATWAYRNFLTRSFGVDIAKVHRVGYPFNWELRTSRHHGRIASSGCLPQRLDLDNNPGVAMRILAEAPLDDKVVFTSATTDLPDDILQACIAADIKPVAADHWREFIDMFAMNEWMVSASQNESFGQVFAEAAMLGVKVCAPRVPGLDELFDPSTLYDPFSIRDAVSRIRNDRPAVLLPVVHDDPVAAMLTIMESR